MTEEFKEPISIVVAEDDPDDRILMQRGFEQSRLLNRIYFVMDGEELLDYLYNRGDYSDAEKYPRPGIILLDLNMPKKDGREVLSEIKADPKLKKIPVVVLTTSKLEEDIIRSYDIGASSYITKPVTFDDLISVLKVIRQYWFEIVILPRDKH